jgi:hypothetical protein
LEFTKVAAVIELPAGTENVNLSLPAGTTKEEAEFSTRGASKYTPDFEERLCGTRNGIPPIAGSAAVCLVPAVKSRPVLFIYNRFSGDAGEQKLT